MHALEKSKMANRVHLVRDGEEALDFLVLPRKFLQTAPSTPRQASCFSI